MSKMIFMFVWFFVKRVSFAYLLFKKKYLFIESNNIPLFIDKNNPKPLSTYQHGLACSMVCVLVGASCTAVHNIRAFC